MEKLNTLIEKKIGLYALIVSCVLLTGCNDKGVEIKDWMKEQEKSLKGKIEKIPEPKAYTPIEYSAKFNPFVLKPIISLSQLTKNRFAPDANRKREVLEEYTLETLKMIGFLSREKKNYAMIKAPDNKIYQVTTGHYLGQNYGIIKDINEGAIYLEERIKEEDEWKIKNTKFLLSEN